MTREFFRVGSGGKKDRVLDGGHGLCRLRRNEADEETGVAVDLVLPRQAEALPGAAFGIKLVGGLVVADVAEILDDRFGTLSAEAVICRPDHVRFSLFRFALLSAGVPELGYA